VFAKVPIVPPQTRIMSAKTVLSVSELITLSAKFHSVQRQIIADVINCESGGKTDAIGALGEVGIVQIYLKYWPSISREQALDPVFSIDFLAHEISHGRGGSWSCFRAIGAD
jgi:hypothetical protein